MKLDLLRDVAVAIERDLQSEDISATCYYHFEENWHSLDESAPAPTTDMLAALEKSLSDNTYHLPKSRTAWFHLNDLLATFALEFSTSPKISKRTKYLERLRAIQINASNAFKVSHNELTGLLSRDAFREKLKTAIDKIERASPKGFVLASEGQLIRSLSVLALDIDKFKQVNDTYGHIYGDQVLKVFAWRLEKAATNLKKIFENKVDIFLGHPSGEEFLVLVVGALSDEDISQIAEKFRLCIADEVLPTDLEWKQLSAGTDLENIPFPRKSDRSVTSSLGVATYARATKGDATNPLALLDRADIALYKSKSGGRNRVTHFDQIMQECGKVLEHDQATSVVAIDIGSKVGVLAGQEFKVYPANYCGSTPFTVDDGRSKKTLGIYPKIELCRILVFNSQSDMSFAYVTEDSKNIAIPVGAILEAVPLGSITHLIRGTGQLSNGDFIYEPQAISGGKELQNHVEQLIQTGKRPFATAIRFRNDNHFLEKYGSAALNRALAKLFSKLEDFKNGLQRIGVIDTTSICFVGDSSDFSHSNIESFLQNNYPNDSELEPICGYYLPFNEDNQEKEEESKIKEQDVFAIELARYALSDSAGFKEKQVQRFTLKVAERILKQHRSAGAYAKGVADYINLKEIGITSGVFENYGGICYSNLKENAKALECYLRACTLSPDNIIYRGNAAQLALRTDQFELGLKIISEIKQEKLDSLKNVSPGAYWTYAVLLAKAKGTDSPLYTPELMKEIGTKALDLDIAKQMPTLSLVDSAVKGLDQLEQVIDKEPM